MIASPRLSWIFNNIEYYINKIDINFIAWHIDIVNDEAPGPPWLSELNEEDVQFLRRFIVSSGSLKAVAEDYRVSYPTVRARLDRLIAKVGAASDPRISDPFQRKLKILAADGEISPRVARELLEAYRNAVQGGNK